MNEHAKRYLERLRGVNLFAIRRDLEDDQVLRFGSNDVEVQCAARDGLAIDRCSRGRDEQIARSLRRQAKPVGMTEAILLGDSAVNDKCGGSIMRLVAGGDDIEILPYRRQVGCGGILRITNFDDIVDAFANIDFGGACFDRDFRFIGRTCLRGEHKEEGQAGHRTLGKSHHQSFSTGTLPNTRAFILRSRSRFSCWRSRTLRSASSIRSRETCGCFWSCFCCSDLVDSSCFFCS